MYATRSQMTELFGQRTLALLTDGGADIDDGVLDGAIRAAQAEVDGYLQGVVPLPLARIPEVLRLHACNIAYFYLDTDNPTEGAQTRYKSAIRYLERLQDGKAGLGTDLDAEPVERAGGVAIDTPGRRFTDDGLAGFTGNLRGGR